METISGPASDSRSGHSEFWGLWGQMGISSGAITRLLICKYCISIQHHSEDEEFFVSIFSSVRGESNTKTGVISMLTFQMWLFINLVVPVNIMFFNSYSKLQDMKRN